MTPEELLYSKTHEWVHVETDASGAKIATLGLSQFALEALTDLVFVDLPEVGRQLAVGEPFGEIESVKAVSDLNSPVAGEVVQANAAVAVDLDTMSNDPYGAGWLVKVKIGDESPLADLLDYAAYRKQCEEEGEE